MKNRTTALMAVMLMAAAAAPAFSENPGTAGTTGTNGPRVTEQQLLGSRLQSTDKQNLGTVTGVIYAANGQPQFLTITPTQSTRKQTGSDISANMLLPVQMLRTDGRTEKLLYAAVDSKEFWTDPAYRDVNSISPAAQPANDE